MKTTLILFFLITVSGIDPDPLRFKDQIDAYLEQDRANPPKPGGYLFIGSSSIRMWQSLKDDFPGLPVINRGFGGSHFSDAVYYYERLVKSYSPRKVVIYEGDNDIASGKTPEKTFKDFRKFIKLILKDFPETDIGVISAKPCPSRWHLKDHYEELNAKIEDYCKQRKELTFVNIYDRMLDKDGKPDPAIFLEDGVHMNNSGYKIWKESILPFLEQ